MTAYTVRGHILGHPPDLNYVEPETVRAQLQTQGVGSSINLTLGTADDNAHKGRGILA